MWNLNEENKSKRPIRKSGNLKIENAGNIPGSAGVLPASSRFCEVVIHLRKLSALESFHARFSELPAFIAKRLECVRLAALLGWKGAP
jgi:hypothetical protein